MDRCEECGKELTPVSTYYWKVAPDEPRHISCKECLDQHGFGDEIPATTNIIDELGFHVGTRTLTISIDECYHKCPYFSTVRTPTGIMVCSHPSADNYGSIINQATCHDGFPPKCPLWREGSMETIEFSAEERGDELNGYLFRAMAVIGAVRQLYHATDTHPYFRAGFSANMYLKLTPEFEKGGGVNTYDGLALIRDESIPDDEIHYISDDVRKLKITNMRKW